MLACSTCNTKGRVAYTYTHASGNSVHRRYHCPACGLRWNSLEFRQEARMTRERALALLADRILLIPRSLHDRG